MITIISDKAMPRHHVISNSSINFRVSANPAIICHLHAARKCIASYLCFFWGWKPGQSPQTWVASAAILEEGVFQHPHSHHNRNPRGGGGEGGLST